MESPDLQTLFAMPDGTPPAVANGDPIAAA